jgi:hypothetical protein
VRARISSSRLHGESPFHSSLAGSSGARRVRRGSPACSITNEAETVAYSTAVHTQHIKHCHRAWCGAQRTFVHVTLRKRDARCEPAEKGVPRACDVDDLCLVLPVRVDPGACARAAQHVRAKFTAADHNGALAITPDTGVDEARRGMLDPFSGWG